MQVEFVGRGFDVTDGLREYATDKLSKVERFLEEPVEVRVTLSQEKRRHIAEIHVSHRFGSVQATDESEHMQDSIHVAVEKAEKQARRGRKKLIEKWRRSESNEPEHWPVEVLDPSSLSEGQKPRIIRSSRLLIKPMTIEEAALQLEDSENEFVVFLDSTDELVSVLYRRPDGNYGLIAPEF